MGPDSKFVSDHAVRKMLRPLKPEGNKRCEIVVIVIIVIANFNL